MKKICSRNIYTFSFLHRSRIIFLTDLILLIILIHDSLTPSVFLLRFDLCRVAASSFCSLETTGPLSDSSTTPFLSRLGCCGKNSNLDGCFVSPSYAPILMATLPLDSFEDWGPLIGETDADEFFANSATGLVAASLGTLLPVPTCRGLPLAEEGLVTGKYVGGGFGTVLGVSFSLNDSMLCISTESSLFWFLERSGSGGGAGGGTGGPVIAVVAVVAAVVVSLSILFSCSWKCKKCKWTEHIMITYYRSNNK